MYCAIQGLVLCLHFSWLLLPCMSAKEFLVHSQESSGLHVSHGHGNALLFCANDSVTLLCCMHLQLLLHTYQRSVFRCRYLEQYSAAAMLEGPASADVARASDAKSQKTAAMVDKFTEKTRPLSLVEQHQQKMKEELKEKKKKQKVGKREEPQKEWRLWDREQDLEIKPKSMQLSADKMGALSSRFGSSQTGKRTFL